MADFAILKSSIEAVIKTNGNKEITGALLQQTLISMVNTIANGYVFGGVVTPESTPGTPDNKVFYIATAAGTYTGLGGGSLDGTTLGIFFWNSNWSKAEISVPTISAITAGLSQKVDKIAGKGLSSNDFTDAEKSRLAITLLTSDIVNSLGEDATKVISQKAITDILGEYAKTTGTYPEFVSGGALTLVGKKPGTATYLLRETGGKGAEVASGQAIVKKIEGNAAAFNQLANIGNSRTVSQNGVTWVIDADKGTVTAKAGGIASPSSSNINVYSQHLINGHKYFVAGCPSGGSESTYRMRFSSGNVSELGGGNIFTSTGAQSSLNAQIYTDYEVISDIVFKPRLIDLTLLGIDNLTTVAQVEAWLANNPGLRPYYAYNPGELLGAKVLGFKPLQTANLLNPTTKKARLVAYEFADGSNQYTVKRLPDGATLKFTPDATGIEETITPSSDHFTINGNGTLEVVTADSVADVWLIMTWDGTKDNISNFVPYNAPTVEFDTSKIYRDVSGTKTQVFPNGMLKADNAGTIRDAVYFDKNTGKWIAELKTLLVDFGNLSWAAYSYAEGSPYPFGYTYASIIGKRSGNLNFINSRYDEIVGGTTDKNLRGDAGSNRLYLIDSSLIGKTGAQVQSTLSGIKAIVELATPVTHTNLYYKTGDNTYVPMEDVFPDDVVLIVNNWATEENLIAEPVDNAPQAVAPQVTTQYSMDIVEWIDSANNGTFISDESMDNALTALASAAGLVYDDSAKTWNNGHWDYSGCFSQIEPNE